jgi:hypothetical protein
MIDQDKIFVDAAQQAVLILDNRQIECSTLEEAARAWSQLDPEQQRTATIKTASRIFNASEIERFHRGEYSDG